MGFHAPSAEEVYRYALRLDESERTLTDRFGWSVLLVGDYSAVSREFLEKYCLDLCARTADRVRFVFFSDVPANEFRHVAERAGRLRHGNGTLAAILRRMGLRPRLDFRDQRWNTLLPTALRPIASEEEVMARLDRGRRELSAVPGARAGLEFAQRLGIGEHVPCLVVFTDVGDVNVHVLPFAGRDADEVYRHVRRWIDDFYRLNHTQLKRWTEVEQQLEESVRALSRPLWVVRNWSANRRRDWGTLRRLSTLSAAPPSDLAELEAILDDSSHLPRQMVTALWNCRTRVAELQEIVQTRQRVAGSVDDLAGARDGRAVRRILGKLAVDAATGRVLGAEAARLLDAVREEFRREYTPEVHEWRKRNGALVAPPVFSAARQSWHRIADQARKPGESPAAHQRRDFGEFSRVFTAQHLALSPGEVVDAALAALARHYGVMDEVEWTAMTDDFREYLTGVVHELRSAAPADFTLVGHCMPNVAPPVRPLSQRQRDLRDDLVRELRRDAGTPTSLEADLEAVLAAVPAVAEGFRAELEATLLADAPPEVTGGETDVERLAGLITVLDDYDSAVRSIAYPHLSDPAAIPVEGMTSVSDAARVKRRGSPPESLRQTATRTLTEYREAERRPLAVPPTPLDALVRALARRSSSDASARTTSTSMSATLAALPPVEAAAVARELGLDADAGTALAAIRAHVGVGVDDPLGLASPAAAQRLAGKVERNEFDVFLAHHSADKSVVHELSRLLRLHGVHPWLDVEQIRPGTWFQDAIQAAVRTVRTAAVCLGPHGLGQWQQLEVRAFVERCVAEGVPVIPVLLPGVTDTPVELPFLSQLNAVRFGRSVVEAEPLRRLLWGVTGENGFQ